MEKQTCPELRFSQYKNDWNETTLGEVVDIVGGGTPDTNVPEFWNGDIDWYSPTEIGENVYANGSLKKITASGLKNSSAKVLPAKKTVLFSSRAGIGDMAILGKPAATNQGFQSFIANSIDVYFLYSMGAKIKKFALSKASGSTFLEISRNQLAQMEFFAPSVESGEQTQIGNFFRNLDQSIALHEKKLTQTQNLKKAMLEKMFPKVGSKQPEIRLKRFSGEWEISILGERNDVRDGTHASPPYVKKGYPLVTSKNLSENGLDLKDVSFISEYDYKEINKRSKVDSGDILLALIGTIGNPVQVTFGNYAIKNMGLIKNGGNIKNEFLLPYLKSNLFLNYVSQKNTGNTQKFLGLDTLRSFEVLIPIVEEQIEIAKFFKQLDETLVLQQQQLQTLKNLKQAFLEKMFV